MIAYMIADMEANEKLNSLIFISQSYLKNRKL